MKVKLILPALTEATSPLFRPIKYSLFPPLGLATLAGDRIRPENRGQIAAQGNARKLDHRVGDARGRAAVAASGRRCRCSSWCCTRGAVSSAR